METSASFEARLAPLLYSTVAPEVRLTKTPVLEFDHVRRLVITALFSDDTILERLALKGGNALTFIYDSPRTSLDVDVSIDDDFPDVADAKARIFEALKKRFAEAGYVVFDMRFETKPLVDGEDDRPWWGGYELKFKVIEQSKYDAFKEMPDKLRIQAAPIGPDQRRVFSVQFSKREYTAGKVERVLDYYTIYVYSPEMIAVEKLRAICQQMPEYTIKGGRRARARDFYDIHLVVERFGVDLTAAENRELVEFIFSAKRVPLAFLGRIVTEREFHRPDWEAVMASVAGELQPYDFYFDFVVTLVGRLKPLWDKEAPT